MREGMPLFSHLEGICGFQILFCPRNGRGGDLPSAYFAESSKPLRKGLRSNPEEDLSPDRHVDIWLGLALEIPGPGLRVSWHKSSSVQVSSLVQQTPAALSRSESCCPGVLAPALPWDFLVATKAWACSWRQDNPQAWL